MTTLLKRLNPINLLFPHICMSCSAPVKTGPDLCSDCKTRFKPYQGNHCKRCGEFLFSAQDIGKECHSCKNRRVVHTHAAFEHKDSIQHAIHQLKYGSQHYWAEYFANCLGDIYADYIRQHDLIITIPLHWSRLRKRGYNQSELLARPIATRFNIELNTKALKRKKSTQYQAQLGFKERQANLSQAFELGTLEAKGQKILLIDDVFTTGATLGFCRDLLKGAARVNGLTISR